MVDSKLSLPTCPAASVGGVVEVVLERQFCLEQQVTTFPHPGLPNSKILAAFGERVWCGDARISAWNNHLKR